MKFSPILAVPVVLIWVAAAAVFYWKKGLKEEGTNNSPVATSEADPLDHSEEEERQTVTSADIADAEAEGVEEQSELSEVGFSPNSPAQELDSLLPGLETDEGAITSRQAELRTIETASTEQSIIGAESIQLGSETAEEMPAAIKVSPELREELREARERADRALAETKKLREELAQIRGGESPDQPVSSELLVDVEETAPSISSVDEPALQTREEAIQTLAPGEAAAVESAEALQPLVIYFNSGSTWIDPIGSATIEEAIELLRRDQSLQLQVRGYADGPGEKDINAIMSRSRADAVHKSFLRAGITHSRLEVVPFGESQAGENEARSLRRVELIFR
ncbi:MAG: OmpA family protein [Verrucomicrobiota bacterium]